MLKTVSEIKNYLAPNIKGAEVGNPALLVGRHSNNDLLFILSGERKENAGVGP